jgi:hypothetical protein
MEAKGLDRVVNYRPVRRDKLEKQTNPSSFKF